MVWNKMEINKTGKTRKTGILILFSMGKDMDIPVQPVQPVLTMEKFK